MKTFDEAVHLIYRQPYGSLPWFQGVHGALEALAAERAAERERPASLPPMVQDGFVVRSAMTPYERAMTEPRLGGQHPHDGRHIMSLRHWGMH